MAATDNVASLFLTVTDWQKSMYRDGLYETDDWLTYPINTLFPWAKNPKIVGNGLHYKFKVGRQDGARATNQFFSTPEFPTPRGPSADDVYLRFNADNSTANDFMFLRGSGKISEADLLNGGEGAAIAVKDVITQDIPKDMDFKLAIFRSIRKTGALGTVNGTPRLNNALAFASATSTATNAGGARLKVSGGSIGLFARGMHLDFYNGSTLVAGNVEVVQVNSDPGEFSLGLQFNSSLDDPSTLNLASIASGNTIYLSGGYNQGMFGPCEWMATPSSGDSFIEGRDRTAAANSFLNCTRLREGQSSAVVDQSHFDQAAEAWGYKRDKDSMAAFLHPSIITTMRGRFASDSIIYLSESGSTGRNYVMGAQAMFYLHPIFGKIELVGDKMATPNSIRLFNRDSWEGCYWGEKMRRMPGDATLGGWWYRENGATPGGPKGLTYRADVAMSVADMTTDPEGNISILNVTA